MSTDTMSDGSPRMPDVTRAEYLRQLAERAFNANKRRDFTLAQKLAGYVRGDERRIVDAEMRRLAEEYRSANPRT